MERREAKLVKGILDRWILVHPHYPDMAWSGSRWVPHDQGLPMAYVQVSNFTDEQAAKEYASDHGLVITE